MTGESAGNGRWLGLERRRVSMAGVAGAVALMLAIGGVYTDVVIKISSLEALAKDNRKARDEPKESLKLLPELDARQRVIETQVQELRDRFDRKSRRDEQQFDRIIRKLDQITGDGG